MIGSTLSHFRITSKLGEGGMGVVWGAEDTDLHRPVALKVLSDETLAREDMRARFMREARTAAALNHPNICTIYEVGEVDRVPFIAMELIEGSSLEKRLSERQLALSELLRIATQIAEAMAAAHAGGIVHRDLKPGNVMLTGDGQVKILDFGLAKPQTALLGGEGDETLAQPISAEMTQQGTILGTVSYMSPEQAAGRDVDSRSDIFSFGALLYQMTTGQLPFRGDTSTSTLAKILETEPESISVVRQGLPPDLERVVRRCLQKQPDARYNDTRDLVAELRDLQTTGESQAATPVEQKGESKKIPAWIWGAALAILVAAVVFLAGPFRKSAVEPAAPEVVAVAEIPSVAVLPFHNLSADEDNAYFSAGITEEIISKLSRIDGLEVASRSSVAAFTDTARDVQQIGRDLGVQYLLDGSVRRAGDQVRVSAQLVDGSTGRNLWSEDFDGNLEDVFAMQEKTALKIAERLDLELSPEEERDVQRHLTDNVAAYDAFLRGMALSRSWGDRESLEEAEVQFALALEQDPDFAAAMAGWAFVESDIYRNFDTTEDRIQHAERLAERAVELDPTMPDASHALGLIAGNRFDYKRASRLLREAVRLDPKEARFWDNLSWALAYETPPDGDGAVQAAREAIRLQPIFPGAYYHLGRGLIAQGKYEEARQAFETSLEQNPQFSSGHLGLAQVHLALGEWDAALAEIEKSGLKETAIVAYYETAAFAGKGEIDEALWSLERALELDYRDFANLDASPYFAALREDPRFSELVQRYQG